MKNCKLLLSSKSHTHTRLYTRTVVMHNVRKRRTLLWPRSHRHARRRHLPQPASVRTHYDQRVTWRPRYSRLPPKPPSSVPVSARQPLCSLLITLRRRPPSLPIPFPPPGLLHARTCSGLGHGLNTMDRREVQSHQTQRRDLRADNRFEKLSRSPDWRIAVFVVNQNAWFTCIVNLALCTWHT